MQGEARFIPQFSVRQPGLISPFLAAKSAKVNGERRAPGLDLQALNQDTITLAVIIATPPVGVERHGTRTPGPDSRFYRKLEGLNNGPVC